MSDPITFNGVSKWYGQVLGLNDATVDIGRGITGLVGPNGAGKTTFMRLCVGNICQNAGEINVLGISPWNNPEIHTILGFSPERDNFYSWMTGVDYLKYACEMFGFSNHDAKSRTTELLELVSLSESANVRISAYSKGMKQRIKVAHALINSPEILILDEPLNGLDPKMRLEMLEMFKRMAKEGTDIILSTHILHEIEKLTDRIVLINRGRIVAKGDVHRIRELINRHPHHINIIASKPAKLKQILVEKDFVESVGGSGEVIEVLTRQPSVFYREIPAISIESGVAIRKMTTADDGLEAVFKYLTKEGYNES